MKKVLPVTILAILLLGQFFSTDAQTASSTVAANDSTRTMKLLNLGRELEASGDIDSSLIVVRQALDISMANNHLVLKSRSYEQLGEIFLSVFDWENFLMYSLRAASGYQESGLLKEEANILITIATEYYNLGIYPKSSEYYVRSHGLLPTESFHTRAIVAEGAAKAFYYIPDHEESLKWYRQALDDFNGARMPEDAVRVKFSIGATLMEMEQYAASEEVYNELYDSFERSNDKVSLAAVENRLGLLRFRQGDLPDAIYRFDLALKMSKGNIEDNTFTAEVFQNQGVSFQNIGNTDDAIEILGQAIKKSEEGANYSRKAEAELTTAIIYLKNEDLYHAEIYCLACIESAKKAPDPEILQQCYLTMSDVMELGNDFITALDFYERHLSIRDSISLQKKLDEDRSRQIQSDLEAIENRLKLSIADEDLRELTLINLRAEALQRENELKLLMSEKELERVEKERLMQSLALDRERYRLESQQMKIDALEQDKRIQELELRRKEIEEQDLMRKNELLESERETQELKAAKEAQARRGTTIVAILLVFITLSILAGLRASRKQNKKLEESKKKIEAINTDLESKNEAIINQNIQITSQKEIIEQKNQSITDSIHYASRIQNAVLPPVDFLGEWGFENFIYFRPKDIVSGDFYWGVRKKGYTIIVAADCTGHGVPGAFMSMLGSAFLNEIVNSLDRFTAADIINQLREEVIKALRQRGEEGEARDGMDISLCVIHPNRKELSFAGANNPLYLLRDGDLKKINGDRMPIGIHHAPYTPFTNRTVEIKSGDTIYLFSDGYADQFGGSKGKKFMYKPFQELIGKISKETLDKQKEILDNEFLNWKGSYEQVDDVLVMGIKI